MQNSHVIEEDGYMIINGVVSFFRKKRYRVALLFCLTVGAIYFYCAVRIAHNVFAPTGNDYYSYLLDAFFHGRTNVITPPSQLDLSLFKNKWYLYWGPAPVLLILPFYLIFHLQASDVLYTAIGGTVNVVLFYAVMQEFKKYFGLSLSLMTEAFLVLSFGLASPNFLLSIVGKIWYTNQIFAMTYLLLFYLLYFRFLKSEKHWQLMLCEVFFCLACLSRYTLVFHGILFLYVFVHSKMVGRAISPRIILSLALIMLTFVSLEALYNFVRFHDMLETGHRFQVGPARFAAVAKSNELLSLHYVLHNMYYCFINIVHFSSGNIPTIIDVEGNSVFSVYPALLLLPVVLYKRKDIDKKRMSFLTVAGIVIGLNILGFMFYQATGADQFGYRYFLDVVPLAFLLLMFILPSIPIVIQMGLLGYGVFVNFSGSMEFCSQFPSFQESLFWCVCVTSVIPFLSYSKVGEDLTEELLSKARNVSLISKIE